MIITVDAEGFIMTRNGQLDFVACVVATKGKRSDRCPAC